MRLGKPTGVLSRTLFQEPACPTTYRGDHDTLSLHLTAVKPSQQFLLARWQQDFSQQSQIWQMHRNSYGPASPPSLESTADRCLWLSTAALLLNKYNAHLRIPTAARAGEEACALSTSRTLEDFHA